MKRASLKMEDKKGKGERGRGRGRDEAKPAPRRRSSSQTSSAESRARRALSVAIIGAGRMGTALALALSSGGHAIEALVARSAASARRASRRTAGALALPASRLDELPPSNLIFITTPDDAIAETVERLVRMHDGARARQSGGVVLHTSGALSSDVLAPLRERGFSVGSMHPLAAVSEGAQAENLRGAFYCVEGDRRAVVVARRVVKELGGRSFSVPTHMKALYHAAAVVCSGHTVALFDVAVGLLVRCGLSGSRARQVLLPLLAGTLDNLTRQDATRALTGTFARADVETVRKHLSALNDSGELDALSLYALLGERSLRLAEAAGARREAVREIARMLDESTATRKGKGRA